MVPGYRDAAVTPLPTPEIPTREIPEIAVVVPTFNRPGQATALLQALATQTLPPAAFEVDPGRRRLDRRHRRHPHGADGPAALPPARPADHSPTGARARPETSAGGPPPPPSSPSWTTTAGPSRAGWRRACATCRPIPRSAWPRAAPGPPTASMSTPCRAGTSGGSSTGATPYFDACNIFYRRSALDQRGRLRRRDRLVAQLRASRAPTPSPGARTPRPAGRWSRTAGPGVSSPTPSSSTRWRPRGLRWHVKNGYLDRVIVALAVAHPGYRREAFWRPWAYRREDAALRPGRGRAAGRHPVAPGGAGRRSLPVVAPPVDPQTQLRRHVRRLRGGGRGPGRGPPERRRQVPDAGALSSALLTCGRPGGPRRCRRGRPSPAGWPRPGRRREAAAAAPPRSAPPGPGGPRGTGEMPPATGSRATGRGVAVVPSARATSCWSRSTRRSSLSSRARSSPARPAETRSTMVSGSDQCGHLAEPNEQAVISRPSPAGHQPPADPVGRRQLASRR